LQWRPACELRNGWSFLVVSRTPIRSSRSLDQGHRHSLATCARNPSPLHWVALARARWADGSDLRDGSPDHESSYATR